MEEKRDRFGWNPFPLGFLLRNILKPFNTVQDDEYIMDCDSTGGMTSSKMAAKIFHPGFFRKMEFLKKAWGFDLIPLFDTFWSIFNDTFPEND